LGILEIITPQPTFEVSIFSTQGSTPTVSKETTGPPTKSRSV